MSYYNQEIVGGGDDAVPYVLGSLIIFKFQLSLKYKKIYIFNLKPITLYLTPSRKIERSSAFSRLLFFLFCMNTYAHPGKPCEMCKFLPNFCKIGCDRISVKSRARVKRTLCEHRASDTGDSEKKEKSAKQLNCQSILNLQDIHCPLFGFTDRICFELAISLGKYSDLFTRDMR